MLKLKREKMSDEELIKKLLEISNFKDLNPVQKEAIKKGLLEGKNLVIFAPAASGKTFCAELAAMNTILKKREKVVYMVPLVALANEKFQTFNQKYRQLGIKIALSVGDMDSADPFLKDYDLIVVSNEKLDSLIRHGAEWIRDIGLIVADEIHLLDQVDRGPTLEIVLTLLKKLIPNAQILALSATIKNAKELAEWLKAETVISEWRPVKLYKGVSYPYRIKFLEKEGYELDDALPLEASVVKNTLSLKKQALFFVSTRKSAESLAEKLGRVIERHLSKIERKELKKLANEIESILEVPTQQCKRIAKCVRLGSAFHHAGLLYKQKSLIEENFRSGLIKVICATPTLSMGVNLPSFRVIMRDLRRYSPGMGAVFIPVLDVQQMLGRCVTGDTVIFTQDGPCEVSELDSRMRSQPEIKILSVDLDTCKLVFSKLIRLWRRKTKKIIEIKLRSGKQIRTTPEHLFLTFLKTSTGKPRSGIHDNLYFYKKVMELRQMYGLGPHKIAKRLNTGRINTIQHWIYEGNKPKIGCFKWKRASDLCKGSSFKNTDHLASLINFHFKVNSSPIDFLPKNKLIYKDGKWFNKQGHQSCKFPSDWSPELCRFIAKIMADGTVYHNKKENSYKIKYFNNSLKVQAEYAKLVFDLFGKKISTKFRRGTYESAFKAMPVGAFLNNIGIPLGKKATILRVPRIIFTLPRECIIEFLREYWKCDGWEDFDHYYIATTSEKLAYDFALLFSSLGFVARIQKKKPNKLRKRFAWEISITKSQFDCGKKFANIKGTIHPDLLKEIKFVEEDCYVYDLTLDPHHNFVANGIIVHNCGRPQYDSFGEGIILAKNEEEAKEIIDHYIHGELEEIRSKLAIEPVLRMHTLALIATEICKSKKSLLEFFSKTFYAYQYGEISTIEGRILDILNDLTKWKFVKRKNRKLFATQIGRRVSELYIDPLTAYNFICSLSKAIKKEIQPFSFLQIVSNTIEMRPLLNIRIGEFSELSEIVAKREELFLEEIPKEEDLEYDEFLRSVKTALMFEDWINEATEDQILTKYKVTPGEFYGRREIADWLIYSLQELALLLGYKELLKHIRKLRIRLHYGVKEELIPLVKLRQIGRIRARKLWSANLRSLADLRKIPLESLAKLVGEKIACSIKEQLGQIPKKKEEKQIILK